MAAFLMVFIASLSLPNLAFGAPLASGLSTPFPYELAFYIAAAIAALAVAAWAITLFVALRARRSICRDMTCVFNPNTQDEAEAPYDFSDIRMMEETLVPEVAAAAPAPAMMDTGVQRAVRADAVQHAVQALRVEVETVTQVDTSFTLVNDYLPAEPTTMDFTDDMIQQVLLAMSPAPAVAAETVPSPAPIASVQPEPAKILEFKPEPAVKRGSHFRDDPDAFVIDDDPETTAELFGLVQQLMQHAQEDIAQRARRVS
jgi:hypothetical protein